MEILSFEYQYILFERHVYCLGRVTSVYSERKCFAPIIPARKVVQANPLHKLR